MKKISLPSEKDNMISQCLDSCYLKVVLFCFYYVIKSLILYYSANNSNEEQYREGTGHYSSRLNE